MRIRTLALPLFALAALGCARDGGAPVAADAAGVAPAVASDEADFRPGQTSADVPEPDAAANPTVDLNDPGAALPTLAQQRGNYYGAELQGVAREDYYWINREAARWPDDLDPRDNSYLPSPEPNVTFRLD